MQWVVRLHVCSRWWLEGWASYVSKGHCFGHLDGDSSSESTDLLMYAHEESGGAPTALLLDGGGVDSIQMHGHGSTSSE